MENITNDTITIATDAILNIYSFLFFYSHTSSVPEWFHPGHVEKGLQQADHIPSLTYRRS